jgi:ADP-ribose pyrophosphatase YjhB (NUDIX family)
MKVAASILVENSKKEFLFVREADPRVLGKLNLPGGHLEPTESVLDCSKRELREETGLESKIDYLIGIYHLPLGLHFVFHAIHNNHEKFKCGDNILSAQWMSIESFRLQRDDVFLHPQKHKMVIEDYLSGIKLPINSIKTLP